MEYKNLKSRNAPKRIKIQLCWILGHCNIEENEKAYLAAKKTGLLCHTSIISKCDLQSLIIIKCSLNWQIYRSS